MLESMIYHSQTFGGVVMTESIGARFAGISRSVVLAHVRFISSNFPRQKFGYNDRRYYSALIHSVLLGLLFILHFLFAPSIRLYSDTQFCPIRNIWALGDNIVLLSTNLMAYEEPPYSKIA